MAPLWDEQANIIAAPEAGGRANAIVHEMLIEDYRPSASSFLNSLFSSAPMRCFAR